MNIEYTEEQIAAIKAKEAAIFEQTIISRNAGDEALKLIQELGNLHTQASISHSKRLLAAAKK